MAAARLRFRRVTLDEALALVQEPVALDEPAVAGYPVEGTRFFALRMLERETADSDPLGMYHVIEQASGALVGHVGFHGGADADDAVRIGYAIASGARRRGYATTAVEWIIEVAAAQPRLSVLRADTSLANVASQRALERNGFARVRADAGSVFYELRVRR